MSLCVRVCVYVCVYLCVSVCVCVCAYACATAAQQDAPTAFGTDGHGSRSPTRGQQARLMTEASPALPPPTRGDPLLSSMTHLHQLISRAQQQLAVNKHELGSPRPLVRVGVVATQDATGGDGGEAEAERDGGDAEADAQEAPRPLRRPLEGEGGWCASAMWNVCILFVECLHSLLLSEQALTTVAVTIQ
jgi:hypothetical protein